MNTLGLIALLILLADILLIGILLKMMGKRIARSAILTLNGGRMPATIQVGGKGAVAVFTEFDGPNGTGNPVAPVGVVSFTSDDPSIANVDASGVVTAVAPGSTNIKGTDPGNGLSASDVITVVPAPVLAQSATLVLTAN